MKCNAVSIVHRQQGAGCTLGILVSFYHACILTILCSYCFRFQVFSSIVISVYSYICQLVGGGYTSNNMVCGTYVAY